MGITLLHSGYVKGEAHCQGDSMMGGTRWEGQEPNKEGTSDHRIPEGKGSSLA